MPLQRRRHERFLRLRDEWIAGAQSGEGGVDVDVDFSEPGVRVALVDGLDEGDVVGGGDGGVGVDDGFGWGGEGRGDGDVG